LLNSGKISHQQALTKATEEYEKFKEQNRNQVTEVEEHFIKQIEEVTKNMLKKLNIMELEKLLGKLSIGE
jgi:hypothetical protein